MADLNATRIGDGAYLVDVDGQVEVVYIAGPPDDLWAFWNGRVFRGPFERRPSSPRAAIAAEGRQSLSAPMPATVRSVLVQPGAAVKKGQTVVILEAMKMELPIRATSDAVVLAVHCREGDLVQPDTSLVDLQ